MRLPENSLFAILLRARWWVSVMAGLIIFFFVRAFAPVGYAIFAAVPFWGIAAYAAWKQLRRLSAKQIAAVLEKARALPAEQFLASLEEGFRRGGYTVARTTGAPADLELNHEGRLTLVVCRRWKAVRTGVDPLREFEFSTAERAAFGRIYVAGGEITDQARAFAAEKNIRLVEGEDLARLLS